MYILSQINIPTPISSSEMQLTVIVSSFLVSPHHHWKHKRISTKKTDFSQLLKKKQKLIY